MKVDLNGYTALVCGSSAGIGKATAQVLADAGAKIILLARNGDKLSQVARSLSNQQLGHAYYTADFDKNAEVEEIAANISSEHQIDILVNNTGGPPAGPAYLAKPGDFLSAFSAHLINNQILTQAFIPGMIERKWGRIVNIISTSVKIPLPNLGVSNTIRGAVGNWSKTLANELGNKGITVNNVLPGATETERLGNIIQNRSEKTGHDEEAIQAEMLSEIPVGRFAKPEEIAYAVCFLSSNFASYINGTNIVVDGGRTGNL